MKSEDILTVEKRLRYSFEDKNLLIRALTRKAFAQERKQQGQSCEDQEVYRILGDAVLKAILVEMLIQKGYSSRESISQRKSELENRESLGKLCAELGISPFIRLGIGEKKQNIASHPSVSGETFEALVAAVYLDTESYEKTKQWTIDLFSRLVSQDLKIQLPNQDLHSSQVFRTEMLISWCNHCFQPDVCRTLRMCHFDITGDD